MNADTADTAGNDVDDFIAKWQGVTASELSTSQSFLIDLCRLLGVDAPHATPEQDYMFERPITFVHGDGSTSSGRIDLYRRGAFVLESKKLRAGAHTRGFDDALLRARSQAENYARALPAEEGRPPLLLVVDVGSRIELYADFTRSGATYTPYPDPRSHRIALADLRDDGTRERLRRAWLDPMSLDPSREYARVTREIAGQLAELARSLERSGHAPEAVARFLMRCLFTMFAEDVRLLPETAFRDLLDKHRAQPEVAMRMLAQLWRDMDGGGFSAAIACDVLRFNGKLFKQPDTLPLDGPQIGLLIAAANTDWKHVEPAIFGTLLERALEPAERHKLGAHYTPRAYVERLVLPTVIEPLRRQWSDAQAAALTLAAEGRHDEAVAELRRFHHRLCTVRVLDPACGSGNFLYVTLEHLKRLEGEVLNALDELGYQQPELAIAGERADAEAGETVDPHNLLGIELNPRAAAIAEVVLWIGYLQWHFRTRGDVKPPQPVIRDFRNIENRDAVLACDRVEYVTDPRGIPVTRWDGETMKPSPVTGEPIPDDTARKPLERYVNPRKAAWPRADFVVGNPPFIGASAMRAALGDGYVEALRGAWPDVPESADFVMYWWHHAAQLVRRGALERFGFITTNSISQTFNRRVVEAAMQAAEDGDSGPFPRARGKVGMGARRKAARGDIAAASPPPQPSPASGGGGRARRLALAFAIPDHPWVDTADGAAVRIAMTVGVAGEQPGRLLLVERESATEQGEADIELNERRGVIQQDLRTGAAVASALPLKAMDGLSSPGLKLHGAGFIVTSEQAKALGLGQTPGLERYIRPYRNGRDLTGTPRNVFVIDLYGLDAEQVRLQFPAVYQHLLERVKPERDQNNRATYRDNWWLHGEPRSAFRPALAGLSRYIATVETSKHRTFQFLDAYIAPDNMLIAIALDDASALGVLGSIVHVTWALATGSRLGVGNDPRYNKTRCFETFPFPDFHAADKFGEPLTRSLEAADGAPGVPVTAGEPLSGRIRALAEQLDAHRKRQQAAHPGLTLTGMYNVLDKLRSGEALTAKERTVHEQGLVSVLRQLHDELDAAVLAAYGWQDLLPLLQVAHGNDASSASPCDVRGRLGGGGVGAGEQSGEEQPLPNPPLSKEGREQSQADAKRAFDEAILERLVALNARRAAEEAQGLVRWLRPDFQHPGEQAAPTQAEIDTAHDDATPAPASAAGKRPWPKDAVEQVRAVADALAASPLPLTAAQLAARFTARGPWKKRVPQLLDMLVALGRATPLDDGRYRATQ